MRPFTEGTSLSARATAFTKNDMKPSFTPCFLMNSSCTCLRRSITALMSTSLKVVRIAAVCWALTRCVAILRRSIDILRRVVRPSVTGSVETRSAAAAGGVKSGFAAAGAATAGAATGAEAGGAGTGTGAAAGVDAGGGAEPAEAGTAGDVTPVSMVAMTAPMETSSPSGVRILKRPDAGASSSLETLSVSSVTSTSPWVTCSPSFLRHLATFAEVMDSPAAGTFSSIVAPDAAGAGAGVSATGTAAAAAATSPEMRAMTVPIETSSPSPMRISSVPSAAASSSVETLSVSKVTRMSPFFTASPFFRCQRATLAEVMDSPAAGTLTSSDMEVRSGKLDFEGLGQQGLELAVVHRLGAGGGA